MAPIPVKILEAAEVIPLVPDPQFYSSKAIIEETRLSTDEEAIESIWEVTSSFLAYYSWAFVNSF
jgi:hypothetical protein